MMTLGMIEYWSEEGFKHLADLGLHAVEFCYNDGNNPDDLIALIPDIKKGASLMSNQTISDSLILVLTKKFLSIS